MLQSSRDSSFVNVGQFNSCGMFQEPKNPEVSVSLRTVKEAPRVLRVQSFFSISQAPYREIECISEPGVMSGFSSHRVDLDQFTFSSIWNRQGLFGCDLFATRFNRQLENLISPFPVPLGQGTKAMSLQGVQWDSIHFSSLRFPCSMR